MLRCNGCFTWEATSLSFPGSKPAHLPPLASHQLSPFLTSSYSISPRFASASLHPFFPPVIARSHQLLATPTSICFRLTASLLFCVTPSLHFPALSPVRTALAS